MPEGPTRDHFNPAVSRSRPEERNFSSSVLLVRCQGWGRGQSPQCEIILLTQLGRNKII